MTQNLMHRVYSAELRLKDLRKTCTHPGTTKVSKSSSGYSGDTYWQECKCHDCQKTWREYG